MTNFIFDSAFQFSAFSNYIISQGYKGITLRLLRRSEILRTHISELSNSKADEDRQKVLVFKTLDVDLICSKRNNSEYLRNVLTQTDAYYHSLYEYASTITRENHKLKQELKQAKLNKKESVQKAEEIRQNYKEEKNSVLLLSFVRGKYCRSRDKFGYCKTKRYC